MCRCGKYPTRQQQHRTGDQTFGDRLRQRCEDPAGEHSPAKRECKPPRFGASAATYTARRASGHL
eukprot:11171526-Heterocapsa_arctica.AAC.1